MKRTLLIIIATTLLFFSCVFEGSADSDAISAVEFVSLSVDNSAGVNHFRLAVKAKKAGNFEGVVDVKKAIQKSLEHFFIGLTLHDDVFWVNLNPNEPDRIISPTIADTDLGRIMLNADYRLKDDASNIINPQNSKIGKEFWERLNKKAEELGMADKIKVITRLWIVPDTAEVYEKGNQLYIVKARLRVQLEPAYFSQKTVFKNTKEKELQDFTSELMEELVLPQLNKKVNEAYCYSDLRDVYNALILSHWYKDKFGSGYNSLLQTVNCQIFDDVETDYVSTPNEIYQSYLKSLKEGRYSFTETDSFGSPFYAVIYTRSYFSGGVDLRDISLRRTASSPLEDSGKDTLFFTCDLFMPRRIDRPLVYAKNQIDVTRGIVAQNAPSAIMLARSLPAIAPVRLAEVNMQSLTSIDKTEKLLLSRL